MIGPTGNDPHSAAERRRQEELKRLGGRAGIQNLPGVRELLEAREQERRERQEAERQKVEAHQEREKARAETEQQELKDQLRQRYLAAGGDSEQFEKPGLL